MNLVVLSIFADPEQALMAIAMTRLGRHYELPVCVNVGLTDGKVPDSRAVLVSSLAGQESYEDS